MGPRLLPMLFTQRWTMSAAFEQIPPFPPLPKGGEGGSGPADSLSEQHCG
jgi:hypothetical protein